MLPVSSPYHEASLFFSENARKWLMKAPFKLFLEQEGNQKPNISTSQTHSSILSTPRPRKSLLQLGTASSSSGHFNSLKRPKRKSAAAQSPTNSDIEELFSSKRQKTDSSF